VIARIPIGQAPQAIAYVPEAVPEGAGREHLQALGIGGAAAHLRLTSKGTKHGVGFTSVALFDQGLTQVLQAAVTGLEPSQPYVLTLSSRRDGEGRLEPLAAFMTNATGSAIVNAVGPIRQLAQGAARAERRYLVIAPGRPGKLGAPVQIQLE